MIKVLLATYFDVVAPLPRGARTRSSKRRRGRDQAADGAGQADARRRGVGGPLRQFRDVAGRRRAAPTAMVDVIRSTLRILVDTGDAQARSAARPGSVSHHQQPVRRRSVHCDRDRRRNAGTRRPRTSLEQHFKALDGQGMGALREVGTLKALQVSFQSGTAELCATTASTEIDGMMDIPAPLSRLSAFVCSGHTGAKRRPAEENRKLSHERAEAVARYMNVTYNVDPNRSRSSAWARRSRCRGCRTNPSAPTGIACRA